MGTESAAPAPIPPAPVIGGRYAVGPELGRGGKARVFLGRDRLLHRDIAIKVFRARAEDPEELKVQEAEAKVVASLNHFALTTLFDAGADTSDPDHPQIYLVMEHVEGTDLRQRLRQGPLPPMQVAYLGFDLSNGLAYLHESGFLHRDIKPANVLLSSRGEEVRLRGKLADFGISSLIGTQRTGDLVTGTAAYLSPEQAAGEDAGEASDVYSLGLVLLEALTGRVAFPGDVTTSVFDRLERDPIVPSWVPDGLREVLVRMTVRDPGARAPLSEVMQRFQDVLVDDLIRQRTTPAAHGEEEARLAAVKRYDVLDTPSEDAFDDVVDLVCRVLGVPVAMVALVDEDRAWFKSKRGTTLDQISRSATADIAATAGAGVWNVPDVLAVPSLRSHPLVAGGPRVRAALAAPLLTHDGLSIGRMLACDVVPRVFTAEEVDTLERFARIVMRELELRLASRRALFNR